MSTLHEMSRRCRHTGSSLRLALTISPQFPGPCRWPCPRFVNIGSCGLAGRSAEIAFVAVVRVVQPRP